MASSVLARRRLDESPVRRSQGHGRSRSRRARRRQVRAPWGYDALAVVVLVIATCASTLTSLYLLTLIDF